MHLPEARPFEVIQCEPNAPYRAVIEHGHVITITAYRKKHPLCEIAGCTERGGVHHVLAGGMGIKCAEVEELLVTLCLNHHTGHDGVHQIGKVEWLKLLGGRIPKKVIDAYAMVGITPDGRFAALPI